MNFVSNIIWNSVEGFVEAGTRTAGGYAGDALIKAGDMIENGGRSVGNGIERRATGYGGKITGQSYQPSPKALPSTARKPVMKRSNSSPAAPSTKKVGSSTPVGANKYPGGNYATKQVTGGAQKALGDVTGGAGKAVGGVTGGARSIAGGDLRGGAQKSLGGVMGGVGKTVGGVTGGAGKAVGGAVGGLGKTVGGATNGASGFNKSLPKPYPDATAKTSNLPKPYGAPAYPTEKKTAVRPGQPKPFTPPPANNAGAKGNTSGGGAKKPYPGTNTLPGQASRTPVKKYKPMERMQGTAEYGKATFV